MVAFCYNSIQILLRMEAAQAVAISILQERNVAN